jgi:cyclopropane fatty-acyl-phospholipid synthase-like methyltransferase
MVFLNLFYLFLFFRKIKMMIEFWNNRYLTKDYVYGTSPNIFLEEELVKLKPGKILFPAEGEGRNAVYAATKKWDVYAFDSSVQGYKKAMLLADKNNVSLHYEVASFDQIDYPASFFDTIALIFAHFNPLNRKDYHRKILTFLKPGGLLLLEGFSKNQIKRKSGGPQNIDMLFSETELYDDFGLLTKLEINELIYDLNEGFYHQGEASVIRLKGMK